MTENFGTTIGNGSRDNMLDSTGSNYGVFGQIEYPVDRIRLVEVMGKPLSLEHVCIDCTCM